MMIEIRRRGTWILYVCASESRKKNCGMLFWPAQNKLIRASAMVGTTRVWEFGPARKEERERGKKKVTIAVI